MRLFLEAVFTWRPREHLQDVIVQNKSSRPLNEQVQADCCIHYKKKKMKSADFTGAGTLLRQSLFYDSK